MASLKIMNMHCPVEFTPLCYTLAPPFASLNPLEEFNDISMKILRGESNFNVIKYQNIIFSLITSSPQEFRQSIINLFNELSMSIYNQIDDLYQADELTADGFINIYNSYNDAYWRLVPYLRLFDTTLIPSNYDRIKNLQLIKTFSGLIKSCVMYDNVINAPFKKGDTSMYIHEILTQLLNSDMDIFELNVSYSIFNFYRIIKDCLDDNDEKIFNVELDNLFMKGTYESVSDLIHSTIIEYMTTNDDSTKESLIKLLRNISRYYPEKSLFSKYYELYFEKRVFMEKFSPRLEIELVSKLSSLRKNSEYNHLMKNIRNKISDYSENKFNYTVFDAPFCVNTEATSKYNNIIQEDTQINLSENIKPFIHRDMDWLNEDDTPEHNITIHPDIAKYFDIYDDVYKTLNPYRDISWKHHHRMSHAIIDMVLNNKTYQFKLSLPQLYLIYLFNDSSQFTARGLAQFLGISLKSLAMILNSFLKTHILVRDKNFKPNDPNVIIRINDNFDNPNDKISLV